MGIKNMEPKYSVSSCRQNTYKSRELLERAQVSQMKQSDNPCQSSGTWEKVPFLCYPTCYAKLHFWLINLFLIHGDLTKTCIGFFICSFEFNGGNNLLPLTFLFYSSSSSFIFWQVPKLSELLVQDFHLLRVCTDVNLPCHLCIYCHKLFKRSYRTNVFKFIWTSTSFPGGKNQPSSPM